VEAPGFSPVNALTIRLRASASADEAGAEAPFILGLNSLG